MVAGKQVKTLVEEYPALYLTFIAVLVALLVVSSAGFFYYLGGRHSTTNVTAQQCQVNMFDTATAVARSEEQPQPL